jgi:bifunctional non-homologous end joining protein LigD
VRLVDLGRGPWCVTETFDDGHALFGAVCEHGLEGVVAKRRGERYRPGERRWIKTKNRNYWRYEQDSNLSGGPSIVGVPERGAVARVAVVRR